MRDFEEVERLQAGIQAWLLRTARGDRHELRGVGGPGRPAHAVRGGVRPRPWPLPTARLPARPGWVSGAAAVGALAFSPDGKDLDADGGDGNVRLWDVATQTQAGATGLVAAACAIADQSLTRRQWAGYAGTQPFQQVCPAS